MATSPLFVADVATLKSKIRLSAVPAGSDATDIIDEAVLTVRGGFYRELGPSRVSALQAIPFVENPTTNDQVLRAVANSTEIKWVKLELMRSLPMLFVDGNADQRQIYHDEALFRDASNRQLDSEMRRLANEIQVNLALLSGAQGIGSERTINVADIKSECTPPRPGDTVRPLHLKRGGIC